MNATKTLSVTDVLELARVIDACTREVPVMWLAESGATLTGVMRHLYSGSNRHGTDVRELTVRISGITEWEIPMQDVLRLIRNGEMALDYRA